jgi:hypothetical protein
MQRRHPIGCPVSAAIFLPLKEEILDITEKILTPLQRGSSPITDLVTYKFQAGREGGLCNRFPPVEGSSTDTTLQKKKKNACDDKISSTAYCAPLFIGKVSPDFRHANACRMNVTIYLICKTE